MGASGGNPVQRGVVELLRGALAFAFIGANSVLWSTLIFCLGLLRPFVPKSRRVPVGTAMMRALEGWVVSAKWMMRVLRVTRIEESADPSREHAMDRLRPDGWYVVVSNHQTWADILVLVSALHGRIPQFKFFTKRELIWVPFIGLAMWFLEFPYVHRYSRDQLRADPTLRGHDRQATLKACESFRVRPTTALIFLEGTRFTPAKRDAQESPYRRLLTPKVGGLSIVLEKLADRLDTVVDVTIRYPGGAPGFWDFCCGRCPKVDIHVRALPAPSGEAGSVRAWVDDLWREKDERLTASHAP